ncbi:MAG: sn-glycerol-3-phosphate ABC transporter ATP-binding protein UgpC [Candidatus Eremiobacteraeota bacterium]|nr:sn-glycerol-3-phosphate ABC transporter ATP-binding protein UgpC [Candidatus Eremiobacteraeota bacterium]
MANVVMKHVKKIYSGTQAIKKAWWELWKPSAEKRDVHVIKDVTLEINDGEFMVLVGPSGCGKSTALRMIAGLEEVTEGEIFIGEQMVNEVSPKDRDIAMVFQNYALYPHMDVYENMAFGLKLRKFPKEEIDKRVQEAAELLSIKHLLARKPKELSGGQRQRVAMGRAIVRKPKVYLMDEPLSNLDAKLRVQMRAELQKLHQRLGVTTIYVTHDQTEAMTLGNRIVILKDGIVQQINTPLHLYEFPANKFVAGFIGSPSMNFLKARVVKDEGGKLKISAEGLEVEIPEERLTAAEPHIGKEVLFGMRPEDIQDLRFSKEDLKRFAVNARVEVSEPMGSEVMLHIKVGEATLAARVDSHTEAKIGNDLTVTLNMHKMHLFDPETERNLIYQEEGFPSS